MRMRKLVPGATELVYDNWNGLVVGFAPTARARADGGRPFRRAVHEAETARADNQIHLAKAASPTADLKASGSDAHVLRGSR